MHRHYGFPTYIGSGAWLTNHQKAVYFDANGKKQRWGYFVKIVVPPPMPSVSAANGTEIGPGIWGAFAIIQEIYNEPRRLLHPAISIA